MPFVAAPVANVGLFGFIKTAARATAGFLTGGASEAVIRGVGAVRQGFRGVSEPMVAGLPAGSRFQVPTPGVVGAVQRFIPGGGTGFTTIPSEFVSPQQLTLPQGTGAPSGLTPAQLQQVVSSVPMIGECPKGFRRNKSSYFLKDGTFVERGARCVRIRRTNPDNFRATNRAARRLLTRKKFNDRADKALETLAPRKRSRSRPAPRRRDGQVIVAGN